MDRHLDQHHAAGLDAMDRYPVQRLLDELHARYMDLTDGNLASYIPELAAMDPSRFAISLVTADGFGYDAGDKEARFTIQSISKALAYGLALEDWGEAHVLWRIGVEPSGDPFNAITFNESTTGLSIPWSMPERSPPWRCSRARTAECRARMQATFERCVGEPVDIDVRVYRSESETGHRNRAIGYLELNAGMIDDNADEILDPYFSNARSG